jgi:hypothetical protein
MEGAPNDAVRNYAPGQGGQLEPGALAAWQAGKLRSFYSRVEFQVDHIEPVAKHWVEDGWNSGDKSRGDHASAATNLRYLSAYWNRLKSSEYKGRTYEFTEKPWVGPNFKSAEADDDSIGGDKFIKASD